MGQDAKNQGSSFNIDVSLPTGQILFSRSNAGKYLKRNSLVYEVEEDDGMQVVHLMFKGLHSPIL